MDLHSALAGLSTLGFDAALDADPGDGWVSLADFATDAALLEAGLRLAGRRYGLPEVSQTPEVSQMSGAWLVGDVAAAVAWPAAAALLTSGAVLVTTPERVRVPHPATGRRLAARLAPLPQERSAEGEVLAFASGITAALAGLVEHVHRRTRRGRHALNATVADMVAAAFHRVGDHLGRCEEARRLADAVLGCADLSGGTNWHDVAWSGGMARTRIRNICCLWYRTPGGDLCLTCPRIDDIRRRELLERRA